MPATSSICTESRGATCSNPSTNYSGSTRFPSAQNVPAVSLENLNSPRLPSTMAPGLTSSAARSGAPQGTEPDEAS